MSDFKFEVDTEGIASQFKELKDKVKQSLNKGVESLATMTHAKTLELASGIGSLSQKYMDNVEFTNPEDNLWVITLKDPAAWIEEGRKAGFMEELLNGKSARTSKEGKKYAVIPFEHSKNPSIQSSQARQVTEQIKKGLKDRDIPYQKIELDKDGSPRLGKLHSFDLDNPKMKDIHKFPATYGVNVYQTKNAQGQVRRDIMTFRVISEDHKAQGLWMHPGTDGKRLLDKSYQWAVETWERDILPNIMKDYK